MFARPSYSKTIFSAFLRRSVTKNTVLVRGVLEHVGLYLFVFLFISRNDKSVGRFPSVGLIPKLRDPIGVFRLLPFYFIISC